MMLDLLGLTDTDEVVYRHELSHPRSTLRQAARATGLAEERVDASRGRLIACGLLRRDQSGSVRAIPSGPAIIAERLRNELEAEHACRRRQVSLFQAEMTRLVNEYLVAPARATRPQVDRITSIDAAAVRVAELLCGARAEVDRAEPGTRFGRSGEADLITPAEIKAAERGVAVRTIYPPIELLSPVTRRMVDREIRAGIAVRTAVLPATSLAIIDRTVAVLTDHRRFDRQHTLLVRESMLVHTLHQLFETFWAQATLLLANGLDQPVEDITAEERLVLRLLGDGLKDEAVAKRLGISVRTVRRKVSDLLRRLRADSRFQAGVLAAQRGWLQAAPVLCCPGAGPPGATDDADVRRIGASVGRVGTGKAVRATPNSSRANPVAARDRPWRSPQRT